MQVNKNELLSAMWIRLATGSKASKNEYTTEGKM